MIEYCANRTSAENLVTYFEEMRRREEIHAVRIFPPYVAKLRKNAVIFEAWENNVLVGFCAMYCNRAEKDYAFIPQVNVSPVVRHMGVGTELIRQSVDYARMLEFHEVRLCVNKNNVAAIAFYSRLGFIKMSETEFQFTMSRKTR